MPGGKAVIATAVWAFPIDHAFQKADRPKGRSPCKRLGTEAEVSAGICFLLSDAAAFISGATLRIDAGGSLQSAFFSLPPARNVTTFQGFHRYVRPRATGD